MRMRLRRSHACAGTPATGTILRERELVLLVAALAFHKARGTIAVRLYRCISFFRPPCVRIAATQTSLSINACKQLDRSTSSRDGQNLSHVSATSAARLSRNRGKFSRRNICGSFSLECHLLHKTTHSEKPDLEHSSMPSSIQERLLAAQSVFSLVSSARAEMACK